MAVKTMTQDERYVNITATFFDSSVPPRPAPIDLQDGPPEWHASDETVVSFVNAQVAADGKSATVEVWGAAVGEGVTISVLGDANMGAGVVETITLVSADTFTVTPGAPGQAVGGTLTIPGAAVPKP